MLALIQQLGGDSTTGTQINNVSLRQKHVLKAQAGTWLCPYCGAKKLAAPSWELLKKANGTPKNFGSNHAVGDK